MSANCNNCRYMDYEDRNRYDEAYCNHLRKYTSLSGGCYSGVPRESGSCYLTTAMCEVLGYADDCEILENLRGYRDWYMLNDPSCEDLLDEYKTVGPVIASKLKSDESKVEIAIFMRDEYIKPAIEFIFEERYDEALSTYIDMTNMLKTMYDVGKQTKNDYKCKRKKTLS